MKKNHSIIPGDEIGVCHFCGRVCDTHKHHIFGASNRHRSEEYGLYVHLCPEHHNMGDAGIHFNREMMGHYHQLGQMAFEADFRKCFRGATDEDARAEFMRIFGKNYL